MYRKKSMVASLMYYPDPLAFQVCGVPSADSLQLSATSWSISVVESCLRKPRQVHQSSTSFSTKYCFLTLPFTDVDT